MTTKTAPSPAIAGRASQSNLEIGFGSLGQSRMKLDALSKLPQNRRVGPGRAHKESSKCTGWEQAQDEVDLAKKSAGILLTEKGPGMLNVEGRNQVNREGCPKAKEILKVTAVFEARTLMPAPCRLLFIQSHVFLKTALQFGDCNRSKAGGHCHFT